MEHFSPYFNYSRDRVYGKRIGDFVERDLHWKSLVRKSFVLSLDTYDNNRVVLFDSESGGISEDTAESQQIIAPVEKNGNLEALINLLMLCIFLRQLEPYNEFSYLHSISEMTSKRSITSEIFYEGVCCSPFGWLPGIFKYVFEWEHLSVRFSRDIITDLSVFQFAKKFFGGDDKEFSEKYLEWFFQLSDNKPVKERTVEIQPADIVPDIFAFVFKKASKEQCGFLKAFVEYYEKRLEKYFKFTVDMTLMDQRE